MAHAYRGKGSQSGQSGVYGCAPGTSTSHGIRLEKGSADMRLTSQAVTTMERRGLYATTWTKCSEGQHNATNFSRATACSTSLASSGRALSKTQSIP